MITTIICDCDGVLSDGLKYVDKTGRRQLTAFHSRDSVACEALVKIGIQVIVITHSDSPAISEYWQRHSASVMYTKQDKGNVLRKAGINFNSAIGIGDDTTDMGFLMECEKAFCPNDAHPILLAKSGKFSKLQRLTSNGGAGVLSEIHYLISNNLIEWNTKSIFGENS